jgi:putative transposase
MTVREVQGYLLEMYGTEVSPDFISKVTDEVMAEVTAWQSRPLEPMYPAVFFDALRVKIRDDAVVRNKAVYLALAVLPDGTREVLGIWIEQTEGAKFWLKVFNELRSRGVNHILIAVVDGLKGLAEAIEAAFPKTTVQTCIVHLIRNSLDYASWRDRKAIATELRPIYTEPPLRRLTTHWRTSLAAAGARNTPPSLSPGAAPGRTSSRSLPFRQRCGA